MEAGVDVVVERIEGPGLEVVFSYGPTSVAGRESGELDCAYPPIRLKIANPDARISYAWSSDPDGTVSFNADGTEGDYTCVIGGTKTITLTATRGSVTSARSVTVICDDSQCFGCFSICGDGVVSCGEECDEPTPRCVDCEIVAFCGDGIIDPPEECDEPTPRCMSTNCQAICVCGDGIACGGEECDDGGPSATCSLNCTFIVDDSPCLDCIASEPALSPYQTTYCDPVAECAAVQLCVLEAGCFSPAPANCYCGPDIDNCDLPDFMPIGPCATEIKAGTGGTTATNEEVLLRLFDLAYPAGAGMALINAASTDADCGPICAPGL